jgi:hypothetical protein
MKLTKAEQEIEDLYVLFGHPFLRSIFPTLSPC